MATVTGLTAAAMLAIRDQMITTGTINGSGHIILTQYDGTPIDVGSISSAVGSASLTTQGVVELATDVETAAGTDNTRAVTPFGLSSVLSGKQSADADLTTIASLTPANSDFLQYKSSAWTNRTLAQVAADLVATSGMAASTSQKGLAQVATNAEVTTGTDALKIVTPAGLASQLASNSDVSTGTDTHKLVTPASLASLVASATAKGIVELADSTETAAGTDATRAVTPAGLMATTASNSQKGVLSTATRAEILAGTDVSKAVTAFGLAGMSPRNDLGYYVPPGWGTFWKAKRAAAGTGLARIAAVGSSSTQGLYSSNLLTAPFVSKLMTQLQTTYGNGGSGYFSTARSLTFLGASTTANAWNALSGNFATVTGAWSIGNPYGPGANYLFSTVNGATISFAKVHGTSIRVYTLSGAGRVNWTYSVDGAAAVSVTDSGTAGSTIQVTNITGLSNADHTIVITHNGAGGSSLAVCGVTGESATGVVVNNYGISGAGSGTFTDFSNNYGAGRWSGGPDYPADLVIYALGANDANAGLSGDAWAINLRQFLQGVKDGTSVGGTAALGNTDVLILMQHIGQYDTTNYKWQDYEERSRGIAESYGAAIVDMWPLGRNSWNYWNSLSYWGNSASSGGVAGTDTIHMSDAGHTATYNAILPILTA